MRGGIGGVWGGRRDGELREVGWGSDVIGLE